MKRSLFVILFTTFSSLTYACPGGDVKSLALADGTELAQVNISTNRVKITDSESEPESLVWNGTGQEIKFICGAGPDFETCDYDQGLLGVKLTADPTGVLTVQIFRNLESLVFNVSNFYVPRGAGGCGGTVNPEASN